MKRKIALSILLVLVLSLLLPAAAFAASDGNLSYVTDSAGILTEEQRQELEDMAAGISEKYQCGVYIVTTPDYTEFGRGNIENCANEIFDKYLGGFGETGDGILLLLSINERDYWIDVHGSFGNFAFPYRTNDVLDNSFLSYFKQNEWFNGFKSYLVTVEQLLIPAEQNYPAYLESLQQSQIEQQKMLQGAKGVGSALVGILTAGGVCGGMKRKMKTAREKDSAEEYMTPTSPHMQIVQDHFINRTRTVQVIQHENRDSGGSSGHSGGGFSGHTGHGGKF